MEQGVPRHEKIRFRRDEIASLDALPSALVQDPALRRPDWRGHALRWAGRMLAAALLLAALVAGALYAVGVAGVGNQRLVAEAETAIRQFTGIDVDARMASHRLSVDSSRFVGIELRDVSLVTEADRAEIIEAGSIRFGIRFVPLMSGQFRLGSAAIENARISPAAMGSDGPRDWTADIVNEDGLIDPDRVADAIFRAAARAFSVLEERATNSVELTEVEIVLPPTAPLQSIRIRSATLTHEGEELALDGRVELDGQEVTLKGRLSNGPNGLVKDLAVELAAERFVVSAGAPSRLEASGRMSINLTGTQSDRDGDRLVADVLLGDAEVVGGRAGAIKGSGRLTASLATGTGKMEIERALFSSGRSRLDFNGAIGPAPRSADPSAAPVYRFELVSNRSTLAPDTSPEPALDFAARLAGTYDAAARRLKTSEIGVRTGPGEILAQAEIELPKGVAPSLDFAMTIPSMPVAHAKQIWPWLAARGAREWVLRNFYGGTLKDSSLRIVVPAGRMGNGVPFSSREMWGRFQVSGSRFDVAGRIPPVRDAEGAVYVGGTDVDIVLESGTVFMTSGRTVSASGGTFRIHDVHRRPLVGALDIAVAGEAPAVIELASYEPINATRRLGIAPEDFSGDVKGRVRADIPLQRDGPMDRLTWDVALDYENLAVAKSFEGQKVTEAKGSIRLDPTKAVIEARARLNGVPAEIAMTNPVGDSGVEQARRVVLEVDDRSRDALAPGLGTIVSGPFRVEATRRTDGGQEVQVSLDRATLSLPWVGWNKGAGVPATARFNLVGSEGTTTLQNFRLEGASFGGSGEIRLAGGGLASARLSGVRLNRGDDVSVSLDRDRGGYRISVRGASLDARPLIKQVLSEAGSGGAGGGGGSRAASVSVDAEVANVLGFGGEALGSVRLAYSGSGSSVGALNVDGVTRGGVPVAIRNGVEASTRRVRMSSSNAGSVLRFLDIYDKIDGGSIALDLSGPVNGALRGRVDARNFAVVDEERLRSLVSSRPAGDTRSLNEAVRSQIDTTKVSFDRGFAVVEKGQGYLKLDSGVLRGSEIGTTFQGTVYDGQGQMALTGTFMPAYGLNRLFGEIPILGQLLGNGRDRGLIGITYKLTGNWQKPELQVNPLSVIAPGIFRSIFEYN